MKALFCIPIVALLVGCVPAPEDKPRIISSREGQYTVVSTSLHRYGKRGGITLQANVSDGFGTYSIDVPGRCTGWEHVRTGTVWTLRQELIQKSDGQYVVMSGLKEQVCAGQ